MEHQVTFKVVTCPVEQEISQSSISNVHNTIPLKNSKTSLTDGVVHSYNLVRMLKVAFAMSTCMFSFQQPRYCVYSVMIQVRSLLELAHARYYMSVEPP